MRASRGSGWSPFGALVLLAAAVFAGCTFKTVLPLNPTVDNAAGLSRVPLTVGVHYSAGFRTYEYARGGGRSKLVVPLGQASETLFDRVLSMTFEKVVPVPGPPPLASGGPTLATVIEPNIERAEVHHPLMVVSMADVESITAAIRSVLA